MKRLRTPEYIPIYGGGLAGNDVSGACVDKLNSTGLGTPESSWRRIETRDTDTAKIDHERDLERERNDNSSRRSRRHHSFRHDRDEELHVLILSTSHHTMSISRRNPTVYVISKPDSHQTFRQQCLRTEQIGGTFGFTRRQQGF